MQMYILSKEDKKVRLGLKDADSTIIEPIIEELNKDPKVEFARFIVDHPDLDDAILEVKVSSGTPESAVKNAALAVEAVFAGLQ